MDDTVNSENTSVATNIRALSIKSCLISSSSPRIPAGPIDSKSCDGVSGHSLNL